MSLGLLIESDIIPNIKSFFHPYYFVNIILSVSFIIAKKVEPVCRFMFSGTEVCDINSWESEVLFFLLVIVMFRTKKSGNRNFLNYISTFSMYAKTCNILLWFSVDPIKGIIYVFLVLVHFLLVGEPVYKGPENVVYFDANGPEEEFNKDQNCYWLIAFYASWNSTCTKIAPGFSKLSLEYSSKSLKFGKIDAGRYPELAKKYHINTSPLSLQLPTVSLYKAGKEIMRRPCLDPQGKFQKFYFTEDNIRAAFDLNNMYAESNKTKTVTVNHAKSE